jgi:hypothetical protein
MLFNTASLGRFYPKSATVQTWFLVSEIATIYSSRFTFCIVQSASKRSCTASKFAQRRTSNKRFKFVRCALWDGVPPPLNLVVIHHRCAESPGVFSHSKDALANFCLSPTAALGQLQSFGACLAHSLSPINCK